MQISAAVMRGLAIVAIIAFAVCTTTGAEKVSPCCVAVSRLMVQEPIIKFEFQSKSPPCIRAVILVTAKKMHCIDPRQPWVRQKITEFLSRKNSTVTPTTVSPRLTSTIPQNSTYSN